MRGTRSCEQSQGDRAGVYCGCRGKPMARVAQGVPGHRPGKKATFRNDPALPNTRSQAQCHNKSQEAVPSPLLLAALLWALYPLIFTVELRPGSAQGPFVHLKPSIDSSPVSSVSSALSSECLGAPQGTCQAQEGVPRVGCRGIPKGGTAVGIWQAGGQSPCDHVLGGGTREGKGNLARAMPSAQATSQA